MTPTSSVHSNFFPDAQFDVVAIAASAGGLQALIKILSDFPADFPAAVVVVQHLDPNHASLMVEILERKLTIAIKQAEQGERLRAGWVYVAPPNHHLLLEPGGVLVLTQTNRVHFLRPSADLLFDSVAASCGKRALAVVLTGTGKDGTVGVQAIKHSGGSVLVQEAETAEFSGMPSSAIQTQIVDRILPLPEIAAAIIQLVTGKRG